MSAAKVLELPDLAPINRALMPEVFGTVQGNGRAIAVAKLREFADKLESGELDGVRLQWRDDEQPQSEMVTVTMDRVKVQMLTTTIEER